ncbi:MAG: glycoside hydrolase family 99-like domain-containing protein [Akkermansiaceae bacterium]|nr:glycoside hydrolase family 99-like domain-containing protein [Akkermansiaceae bacterium]NNM28964.1 glycoside hydrolase family 99-like domain-containing protein [Akkermansiaceae bacterium]
MHGTKSRVLEQCESAAPGELTGGRRARLIAFYLPQFHPIPENDEWWESGFTEWTNVAKAKPLFPGHWQPRLPADLGFYDLRVPETRHAQAELARKAGIEGFCYWHYWFGGKRLLERPFMEMVASGEPDYPFCVGWANQSWTGTWHGAPNRILMEQTYPGAEDHERHFHALLPAMLDSRHICVEGKPLVLIYAPRELPEAARFLEQWRNLASSNGLSGLHFVANLWARDDDYDPIEEGFDGVVYSNPRAVSAYSKYDIALARSNGTDAAPLWHKAQAFRHALPDRVRHRLRRWRRQPLEVFRYADAVGVLDRELRTASGGQREYPCVLPNWDNSPRSGRRALILTDSSPELFRGHLRRALDWAERLPRENRLVFVKSWNEWAEGNYLEPDQRFGHRYLDVVREECMDGRDSAVV